MVLQSSIRYIWHRKIASANPLIEIASDGFEPNAARRALSEVSLESP
jgi:hypothetical protein